MFSGVGLIALILYFQLVFLPLIGKAEKSADKYFANKELLMAMDRKETLFKELEKKYEDREEQLLLVKKTFLDEDEIVGFISTIEEVAEETGNVFEIKTASSFEAGEEEEGDLPFLSLRISLWGSFSSFLHFLANIEDSPYPPYRLTEITDLRISKLGGEPVSEEDASASGSRLESVMGIKVFTSQ